MTLPPKIITLLAPFAPLFSPLVFERAQELILGAILTPGRRTVAAALRALGLQHQAHFQNYHRVLNRATWCPRRAAQVLLRLLVSSFVPSGPLIFGLDDTLERRRGAHIKAKGIYRDAVRSSRSHFVKSSGLRWLSLMLLTPIPWANRVWALPVLTALASSERAQNKRAPQRQNAKKLTDFARQMLWQVRRWWPHRPLVVVADSAFAALELLASWNAPALYAPITAIVRFRLDAALYQPAPQRKPGQIGRTRRKGARLPTLATRLEDPATEWQTVEINHWYGRTTNSNSAHSAHSVNAANSAHSARTLEVATGTAVWYHSGMSVVPLRWVLVRDPAGELEPMALLCTDLERTPAEIISWYARRWCVEVTFQEVRAHLGVETQRQWNDLAIARTTPCLLGLFSLVTLLAHQLRPKYGHQVRCSAWYDKEHPTFADALAWCRQEGWEHAWNRRKSPFCLSHSPLDTHKLQAHFLQRVTQLLCYAN